jgi:ankyrin repeat protein
MFIRSIKLLLKNGANVNTINIDNEAPIYVALRFNDIKLINLLIKYGAMMLTSYFIRCSIRLQQQSWQYFYTQNCLQMESNRK